VSPWMAGNLNSFVCANVAAGQHDSASAATASTPPGLRRWDNT